MRLKLLFTAFSPIVFVSAFCQSGQDTAFVSAAVQNCIRLYKDGIGAQARLYNGSKYIAPEQTFEQYPYFLIDDWIMGDVCYDGECFKNVPLMYDLNNGQLITEHYSNGQPIQLVAEKVRRFTLSGHNFRNIENGSVGNSLPETGFYDILYPGRTRVIAKRQKHLREEIESAVIITSYDEKNRYFLFKDEFFHPVKTKRAVLKLLADQKQQLKKFLRQRHLNFKDNRELVLKDLAEYYDTLR